MLYADFARRKFHNLCIVKSAEGYPCTLTKSLGKALKNYEVYGNTSQTETKHGAIYTDGLIMTPRIPISWSNIAKIKLVGKQTPASQSIFLCTYGGVWIGSSSGTGDWAFNGGVTGTADKTYTEFANGEVNDVTFEVTSTSNTDYLTFVWDGVWSKARTIYRATFWNSSNEVIADIECMENGKFFNHTTSTYLDNYTSGLTSGVVTDSVFDTESYENIIPTPEAPIEVISLGEKSRNLFDSSKFVIGGVAGGTGKDWATTTRIRSDYVEVEQNTQYTLTVPDGTMFANTHYYDKDKALISRFNFNDPPKKNTITTPSNTKYFRFSIKKSNDASYTNQELEAIKEAQWQLEKGTVATEYKPYRYVDINVSGKNLFDEVNKPATPYSGYRKLYGFKNETITYSLTVSVADTDSRTYPRVSLHCYYTDGTNTNEQKTINSNTIHTPKRYSVTLTPDSTKIIDYMEFRQCDYSSGANSAPMVTEEMIEYNSTATDYEPYQEPITTTIDLTGHEPLRKVDDISDYIDYENQKIVRNIRRYELTGYETWYQNGAAIWTSLNSKSFWFKPNPSCKGSTSRITVYSNKFEPIYRLGNFENKTNIVVIAGAGDEIDFKMVIDNVTTIAEWKTYLQTQKANGTPVVVYYQLANPVEEDITLPTINTLKNTNVITSYDDELQASNISATYKSSKNS